MIMLVPAIKTLTQLPTKEAMQSCSENEVAYNPELWELQYQGYRFLERVPAKELELRHRDILKNIRVYVQPDAFKIPIISYLSSWYWLRKEHQTRLEFKLRCGYVPETIELEEQQYSATDNPARTIGKFEKLYKFSDKKYLEDALHNGSILIRPALEFKAMENDNARQDDELKKSTFMPGSYTQVLTMSGQRIPIIGNLTKSVSIGNYYAYCISSEYDTELYSDFEADACLEIYDVDAFAHRLSSAAAIVLPDCEFEHLPVQYFDPYEICKNEHVDPILSKDFRFAYQKEYRFFWFSRGKFSTTGNQVLKLGNLADIAKISYR